MRNKIRILIIDDEQSILDLLQLILELQPDFEVKTTTEVQEWYSLLEQFPIDVILVDYRMPALSGEEFIRRLNTSKFRSLIHGIGLFSATPFSLAEVQRMGADLFIEKPFDVEKLLLDLRKLAGTTDTAA